MSLTEGILRFRRFVWRRLRLPGPPPGITLDDAGNLFEKGMKHLRRGQHQKALSIAKQLRGYKYTGADEIEAVALHETGDTDGAIAVLQQGMAKGGVWRLGHLLGIYLSDQGRYDEALSAFEASLGMREPEPKMTNYNKAIVYNRVGQTDEAIKLLKEVVSSKSGSGEPEAVELARSFLRHLTSDLPKKPPPRRRRTQRVARGRRRRQ